MVTAYVGEQAWNVVPPRLGQIIVLSVNSTSTAYDLTKLLFNNCVAGTKNLDDYYYLSFQCETNDVFIAFDQQATTASGGLGGDTILDTTTTAVGGTIALDAPNTATVISAQCARLVSGLPPVDMRIERQIDKTLIVKCAAGQTAILRFWSSSQSMPGI